MSAKREPISSAKGFSKNLALAWRAGEAPALPVSASSRLQRCSRSAGGVRTVKKKTSRPFQKVAAGVTEVFWRLVLSNYARTRLTNPLLHKEEAVGKSKNVVTMAIAHIR